MTKKILTCTLTHAQILRKANSMQAFADGDPTFVLGDWRAWEAACLSEGRTVPPAEFKALPKEARRAYLKMPNSRGTLGA